MHAALVAAREAEKHSSDRSPTKSALKRKLSEVFVISVKMFTSPARTPPPPPYPLDTHTPG